LDTTIYQEYVETRNFASLQRSLSTSMSIESNSLLRLVAQALGGRALTPEAGQEITNNNRTKEQQQIDTLLASWKRVIEDNLFTQSK
jgi:putative DNA methylase